MSEDKTVIFTEVVDHDISVLFGLNDVIEYDYTDPPAVEIPMRIDLKFRDGDGKLWKISDEDKHPILHLVMEDGA